MAYGSAFIDAVTSSGNLSISGGVIINSAFTEQVYAITDSGSVDINPSNGTVQTWTLGSSRTPTASTFNSGQSVTLMISSGANTITWTTIGVTWVTSTAPSLSSSGVNVIVLWKVNSVIYGQYIGVAS